MGAPKKHGWNQLLSDQCVFNFIDDSLKDSDGNPTVVGIIGLHVDDFAIAGDHVNETFKEAREKLKDAYDWGKWETQEFVFAGNRLKQFLSGDITLDQQDYVNGFVEEIVISKERMKLLDNDITEHERHMLRSTLGSLSWKACRSGPQFSADVAHC